MQDVPAARLLEAWERSLGSDGGERPLDMLAVATDAGDDVGAWSLGRRNTALLSLRESLFGATVTAIVSCPSCAERLEIDLRTDDLRAAPAPSGAPAIVRIAGYTIEFRLLDGSDFAAAARCAAVADARLVLLERCVVSCVNEAGAVVPASSLPPEGIAALSERLAEADPHADVSIDTSCPSCAHQWRQQLDVAVFVMAEIDVWARRTLHDVAGLARAYGWNEAEVLALSPLRRRMYLEMAGA